MRDALSQPVTSGARRAFGITERKRYITPVRAAVATVPRLCWARGLKLRPSWLPRGCGQDSVALSLCTTAHPLHTRFTKRICTSISEATMRPNPRRGADAKIATAVCQAIARCGHLSVLQWARESGYNWDEATCAEAAGGGHLELLQWARGNGCDWDEGTCHAAAAEGRVEVLRWSMVNGCDWIYYDDDDGQDDDEGIPQHGIFRAAVQVHTPAQRSDRMDSMDYASSGRPFRFRQLSAALWVMPAQRPCLRRAATSTF
jgi:hypothetical protein